jgi:hypothetical protein
MKFSNLNIFKNVIKRNKKTKLKRKKEYKEKKKERKQRKEKRKRETRPGWMGQPTPRAGCAVWCKRRLDRRIGFFVTGHP